MDREKQIEEMARLMCANYDGESGFCGDGEICSHDCWAYREATYLYDMGYRKQSEVAREIFEETDRMCIDTFGNFNNRVFAELKKKYTEEQK